MEVPVRIDGKEAGVLRVTRSGLYTVLEAELEGGTGALLRLWVHGGGKSAYLGVMQPRGAGLWLRRSLSRSELGAFPSPIEFASDREDEGEDVGKGSLHNDNSELEEEPVAAPEPPRETDHSACPWPAEPPEEGLLWYRRPDGSLTAFDGVSSLLALPAELRGQSPQSALRVIEGKKYLVFRY